MIDILKTVTQYLANGVEGCAALIIAIAAIQATVRAILLFFRKPQTDPKLKTISLQSWQQILMFVAIFALRFILKRLFTWEQERLRRRLGETM